MPVGIPRICGAYERGIQLVLNDGAWAGKPAVICGGGPSLRYFEWSRIRPVSNVIAINRAYQDAPYASIFFTEDLRFIQRYAQRDDWKAFAGLKVFHCLDASYRAPALEADATLHIIDRKRKDKYWSSSLADGLSYSSNSGVGAINLAQILGATRIYLLGFDCRVDGERANYHDDYARSATFRDDWRTGIHMADDFASDFTHWVAPHVRDVDILNVISPVCESALSCWPTITMDEYYRRAIAQEILP